MHFNVGFASFYNSLLEEVFGKGNLVGTRILPFFIDLDHVFMIDPQGNILPSYEIRCTKEVLPDDYLKLRCMDAAGIPKETNNTGVSDEKPQISQSDILFSPLDARNAILKLWSQREGHLLAFE